AEDKGRAIRADCVAPAAPGLTSGPQEILGDGCARLDAEHATPAATRTGRADVFLVVHRAGETPVRDGPGMLDDFIRARGARLQPSHGQLDHPGLAAFGELPPALHVEREA